MARASRTVYLILCRVRTLSLCDRLIAEHTLFLSVVRLPRMTQRRLRVMALLR
jgi:hypothetical protein